MTKNVVTPNFHDLTPFFHFRCRYLRGHDDEAPQTGIRNIETATPDPMVEFILCLHCRWRTDFNHEALYRVSEKTDLPMDRLLTSLFARLTMVPYIPMDKSKGFTALFR